MEKMMSKKAKKNDNGFRGSVKNPNVQSQGGLVKRPQLGSK